MAALQAFELALRALLSDKPHQIDLFNTTFLNKLPDKEILEIHTFAQFCSRKIHGIPIVNLSDYFTKIITEFNQNDDNLYTYWNNLAKVFENHLSQQIMTLYAYPEKISLLDG